MVVIFGSCMFHAGETSKFAIIPGVLTHGSFFTSVYCTINSMLHVMHQFTRRPHYRVCWYNLTQDIEIAMYFNYYIMCTYCELHRNKSRTYFSVTSWCILIFELMYFICKYVVVRKFILLIVEGGGGNDIVVYKIKELKMKKSN